MIEVTKVLDKWIEQGAIFSDINMVAREVYWWLPQLMMDKVTPMELSFNDILYGDSNLWEVMYPEREKEELRKETVLYGSILTIWPIYHLMT